MSSEAVARRYARAVFELAKEKGAVGEISREIAAFADAYLVSSELRAIEHTPGLTDQDRRAVIEEIGKRMSSSETTVRAISLLAERQRLAVLPALVRLLDLMADEHLGLVRAHVTSARALPQDYRAKLEKKIADATGKRVLMTFEEDPSLIAGVVTQVGDRVVDGSVRGRLNQLAASLRHS